MESSKEEPAYNNTNGNKSDSDDDSSDKSDSSDDGSNDKGPTRGLVFPSGRSKHADSRGLSVYIDECNLLLTIAVT